MTSHGPRSAPRSDAAIIQVRDSCKKGINVKGYSMPAIGRRNVHTSARVGGRRINPMEETAECPNAVGGFAAMAIDRPGWSVLSKAARSVGVPEGH